VIHGQGRWLKTNEMVLGPSAGQETLNLVDTESESVSILYTQDENHIRNLIRILSKILSRILVRFLLKTLNRSMRGTPCERSWEISHR
jgi:hypothetical protein